VTINRIGSPSSAASGIAIERTCKGKIHRYSFRAWHPGASIPAVYFTREELARFLGLTVPPRPARRRGRIRI
jgi:hypothetical protein